ncbi:caspase family protein [Rhodococcus sp. NPDC059968]|uniref:caspase family protein n=1 Tax=Rhodococcus sp. NPDC059968 TaxID=3347017 RepID=UPI0036733107
MAGYSLHIGLNIVDKTAYGGWNGALSGCVNDANAMAELAASAGFSHNTKLLNKDATSSAIIGGISQLACNASSGDICLITYSGHGGQVADQNGEEDDFKDETWVAYDRQIVDDELYQMWSQFDSDVRIVVCSDSCHSGTVIRDFVIQKTRESVMENVRTLPKAQADRINIVDGAAKALPLDVQRDDNKRRRETYQFVQALSGRKSAADIQASVLLLAGCQDSQYSYDGATNGQFTQALLQTWSNGFYQGSYTTFVGSIAEKMPPDQVPNLDLINANSEFVDQRPFEI